MKTVSKDINETALKLARIIEERKNLEKEEALLKSYFKEKATNGIVDTLDIVISVETKSRTGLDRGLMVKELGEYEVRRFEKVTQYQQVNVVRKRG